MSPAQLFLTGSDLNEYLQLLDGGEPPPFAPPSPPENFPHFQLIPLTPRRGWPIALCEATVGRRLPGYGERLRWRDELPLPHSAGILIFTDPAHALFVWSWRVAVSGWGEQHFELHLPQREAALQGALKRLPPFPSSPLALAAAPHPVVLERLLPLMNNRELREAAGEDAGPLLREWIEGISLPAELRRLWRSLRRFRVLDLRCSPGRLLQAASALELVYVATLGRIRSLVDDAASGRERRRPEHLRDLRLIVEEAEHPRWRSDERMFVRRLIVQQNLFGVTRSPGTAAACVRALLRYAGSFEDRLPLLDCNIWLEPKGGQHERGNGTSQNLENEDVEILARSLAYVRTLRIGGGELPELRRAEAQLDTRRRILRRQLESIRSDQSIRQLEELTFGPLTGPLRYSVTLD